MATKLSGSEFIAEYLIKEGLPYVFGLPGHGVLALLDAFRKRQDKIKMVTFRHEQAATYAADGYYRATGKPMVAYTTVGPGAINALTGISTAFMDSIPMIFLTANCPTYMNEKGAMQEIDRNHWSDTSEVIRPIVKRTWNVTDAKQLYDVLPRAFRVAVTGRPGPVHIDLPMDVQSQMIDLPVPDPSKHRISTRIQGPKDEIVRAAKLLVGARRPLILAGGGVIGSGASPELMDLAELLGIPVVGTFNGKGSMAEDHPLWNYYVGYMGSSCGNHLTRNADVILAIGCRFSEWTCSSYRDGITFNPESTQFIHVDIDPREISKNYPVEVGIMGDCKAVLQQILDEMEDTKPADYLNLPYIIEAQKEKKKWEATLDTCAQPKPGMLTTVGVLYELREYLDRDAIILSDAGHIQGDVWRGFPVYQPRTHLSSGGSSVMGFSLCAGIGAKMVYPNRQVVGVVGDGGFLMTCQELATASNYEVPLVMVVCNNQGWISIKDLQLIRYGKDCSFHTDFTDRGGELGQVNFQKMADAFGCYSKRVTKRAEVKPALKEAFASGRPALIEAMVETKFPYNVIPITGWADFPVPEYADEHEKMDDTLIPAGW